MSRQKKWIAIFSIGIIILYLAGVWISARANNTAFNSVVVFNPARPDLSPGWLIITALITISAMLLIFIVPGLVWTLGVARPFKNYPSLLGTVFAVNTIVLMLSTTLFKLIARSPMNRAKFLVIVAVLTISGLLYLLTKGDLSEKIRHLPKMGRYEVAVGVAGAVFVLLVLIAFRGKVFRENFLGDGVEQFRLASSLKEHVLPYWILFGRSEPEEGGNEESGHPNEPGEGVSPSRALEEGEGFGYPIPNPNMMYPWLTSFSILLLGECEAALRLPVFVYLLGVYFAMVVLISPPARGAFAVLFTLSILLLYTIIMFFYTGYNPYFTDIGVPPGLDTLFTLFLLWQIYFLLNGNKTLFVAFAVFSALTRYSGPVFTVILLAAYGIFFKGDRRSLRKAAAQYVIVSFLVAVAYFLYGWTHKYLGYWYASAEVEYLRDYLAPNSRANILLFARYFIIFSGGLPVLGLFFLKSKDNVSRLLSILTLIYLLIVLSSGYKALHYLAPIALLPGIVFLRHISMSDRKHVILMSKGLCLASVICLVLMILPKMYYVNTANREFGTRTCMMFSSYEEAVRHAGIIYDVHEKGDIGWYIGKQTWVEYADISRSPVKEKYDFYLTGDRQPPEPGFRLVASIPDMTYLYARNEDTVSEIRNKQVPDRKKVFSDLFKGIANQ